MYCTTEVHLDKTSFDTLETFSTVMSLFEPVMPKHACQIHTSCDVMALRMIIGL